MAKRKGQRGRPYAINAQVITKLEEACALDCSIDEMCLYANIAPMTYYSFIKKHPDLLERFTALRNRPVLKARNTVVGALGEPIHAFKYLEKKRRAEFGEKIAVEHSGEIGQPIISGAEDDKLATEEYLKKLEANRVKRSLEKAKQDHEIA